MDKSKRLLEYVTGRKGAKGEYEKLVADIANSKRRALAPEVGRLRAVKSLNEQKVMRQASDISGRAHAKVGHSTESITIRTHVLE
jgi:intermediate cleaving peptidase 55